MQFAMRMVWIARVNVESLEYMENDYPIDTNTRPATTPAPLSYGLFLSLYACRRQNVKLRLRRAKARASVNYYPIDTDTLQATTPAALSY